MVKSGSKNFTRLVIAGLSLLVIAGGFMVLSHQSPRLSLGDRVFHYELASTPAEQEQGLSDRDSLPADQAMLFAFAQSNEACFWMKDMRFSLDMIWLNEQKQVIYIKENATPASYPEQFCPTKPARYVVEVNAGTVSKTRLRLGDTAKF